MSNVNCEKDSLFRQTVLDKRSFEFWTGVWIKFHYMPMCSWACLGPCPMVFGENKKSCWEKVLKSINFHTYCQSIICSDSGPVEIKVQEI